MDKQAYVNMALEQFQKGRRSITELMVDYAPRFRGVDGEKALRDLAEMINNSIAKSEASDGK